MCLFGRGKLDPGAALDCQCKHTGVLTESFHLTRLCRASALGEGIAANSARAGD